MHIIVGTLGILAVTLGKMYAELGTVTCICMYSDLHR